MKSGRPLPTWAEVAASIAPIDQAPWVVNLLRDWASSLMLDRAVHDAQPTKAKMRKILTNVANAAKTLQFALGNDSTREFLELEGSVRIENRGGLDHALRTIAERAALAAVSPRISASSKTAKRGKGRALPADALSPKTFCAVIASETCKYLHHTYPGSRNVKAATAADLLWRASGGPTEGWGNSLNSWRYHFERANSAAADKIRQEIRRHCVEHSHSHQQLSQSGK